MFDFAIIGSGMFGATLAERLTRGGKSVIVFESEHEPGGAVRDYYDSSAKCYVHKFGPHILHTDDELVWKYLTSFSTMLPFINSPIAIAPNRQIYHLPFNMDTFYKVYKTYDIEKIKKLIDEDKYFTGDPEDNLQNKAISLVGRKIYELLIKGYTEKQWGTPCDELPANIITRLPLRFTWNNNYFNDKYQGIPSCGYSYMIGSILDGIKIKCDTKVNLVDIRKYIQQTIANKVIYTGRVDTLYNYDFGSLGYRRLMFHHEQSNKTQGIAVVNYTDAKIPYTRITESLYFDHRNTFEGITVKTYEYPVSEGENNCYYPINNNGNSRIYECYKEQAKKDGIILGGRLGMYKYMNMDVAVREAMNLADDLLRGKQ